MNEPDDLLLMDHEADGIRELDNKLPRWWVWLFYFTILFAAVYLVYYHVLAAGDLMTAEYFKEMKRGEALMGFRGAYKVQAFKEKPDKATADRYVESGRYYWNSGMFVWRADTVLNELATFLPDAHRGHMRIAEAWGTPQQNDVLNQVYPNLPKIAVDFAIMEPASHGKGKAQVMVIELPVQWLDVGSWPALAETLQTDDHDNAIRAETIVLIDCDDNIIISDDPQHLISAIGMSDMILVHTRDATLVCPKRDAQRVKELVLKARDKYGDRFQ